MNLVEVFNRTRVRVDEEAVARLVARVLAAEGVDNAESSVELVGERRIRALNAEHRGKDEVTDVLSFPLEDAGEGPGPAAGSDLAELHGRHLGEREHVGDLVLPEVPQVKALYLFFTHQDDAQLKVAARRHPPEHAFQAPPKTAGAPPFPRSP